MIFCVLFAGCTTTPTPPETPAPTQVLITEPVTSTPVLTSQMPEPVRTLPQLQQINLVLTKDRPTSEIHLLYQGGPGDGLVSRIWIVVHAADGTTSEYVMSDAKKPVPGDELVAPGTRSPDRVEVFVTSSGVTYKVSDGPVLGGGYY